MLLRNELPKNYENTVDHKAGRPPPRSFRARGGESGSLWLSLGRVGFALGRVGARWGCVGTRWGALGLRWDVLGRVGVASGNLGMPWGAFGRVEKRRELWVKPGR